MKRLQGLLILLVVLLWSGCSGLKISRQFRSTASDWVAYGGSSTHVNISQPTARPPFDQIWEYNAQAGISGTPLIRDSVIIVTTLAGELQAVNLSDGKRLGYTLLESAVAGTPVLDGPSAILTLAGKTETVVCYDLVEGLKIWSFQAGPVESSPLVHEGRVYVVNLNGVAYCLSKSHGEEIWKYDTEEAGRKTFVRSSPATNGKIVVFGNDRGTIYALDCPSGSLRWKFEGRGSMFAGPVIEDSSVLVGSLEGTMYCLNATDGHLEWKYETGSKIYGSCAASAAMVVVGSANGVLHALDRKTGKRVWRFAAKSVINSAPLLAGEFAYIGSLDRTLYVLKISDGEEVWRYKTEGRIKASPVMWGSLLFLTTEDRMVTALKSKEPL